MKLLLIGVAHFNYVDAIIAEAEETGYEVTRYNIEPWSYYRKFLRRLSPSRFRAMRDREHKEIIAREKKTSYDVVLFIQCHQFSLENFQELRRTQGNARFILYNWDSVRTFDYSLYIPLFDKVATFDRADAQRLGVMYLPLFCIRELQPSRGAKAQKRRVYFVGRVEGARRYAPIRRFMKYCRENGIEFDCHMVAMHWGAYFDLLRHGFLPRGLSSRILSKAELREKMDKASAVFDVANYAQTGFTMRIMENLCAGKKLITESKNIRKEKFYSPDRILVFENDDFSEVAEFLNRELPERDETMREFYVQNFVGQLLAPGAVQFPANSAQHIKKID